MYKSSLASLAAAVLWASVSFGQAPDAPAKPMQDKTPAPQPMPPVPAASGTQTAPPKPMPEKLPVPQEAAAQSTPAKVAPAPPAPALMANPDDGFKAPGCCQPGVTESGVFSADVEYVLWWYASGKDNLPLDSSLIPGNPNNVIQGSLGDAEHTRRMPSSGVRLALGYWDVQSNPWVCEGVRELGAEAVFFFVGQRSASIMDDSSPSIVRPFFDVTNRQNSGFIVASPGLATGAITGLSQVNLWGAEANLWKNVYTEYPGTNATVSVLAGFRYLDLKERLSVGSVSRFNQDLTAFPTFQGLGLAGNTVQISDSFATHNHFYGGQIGASGKWRPMDNLYFEGTFKLALGVTEEDLEIAGGQLRTLANGTTVASPSGLYALPSNSGHYRTDHFAQVPEGDFKVGAPINSHVTATLGFSALYWSRIMRPGAQVDFREDITQIPNFPTGGAAATGLNLPRVPLRQGDIWLLGINVGLEVRF